MDVIKLQCLDALFSSRLPMESLRMKLVEMCMEEFAASVVTRGMS